MIVKIIQNWYPTNINDLAILMVLLTVAVSLSQQESLARCES